MNFYNSHPILYWIGMSLAGCGILCLAVIAAFIVLIVLNIVGVI